MIIPNTDHQQFTEQVLPYIPRLEGFAMSLMSDPDAMYDLVQDTLLTAYRFWYKFEQGTNLHGWLFRIMKNLFINHTRRHRIYTISFSEEGFEWLLDVSDVDQPRSEVFSDEVQSAFFALKDEFREVLILSDLEDMSHQEIADRLNVPSGTVKCRIHRARKALRASLCNYAKVQGYQQRSGRMGRGYNIHRRKGELV